METIEQLQQTNAKLTERLNNAAKFFREQKAQIEALTKENEELKRTPREEVISVDKWNDLVDERDNLKSALESTNKQLSDFNKMTEQLISEKNELNEQIEKVRQTSEENAKNLAKAIEQVKEERDKYEVLEKENIEINKAHKELASENDNLKVKIGQIENEKNVLIDKYKNEYESLQGQLIKATNEFNQLREFTIKSKEENNKIIEDYKNLIDEKTKLAKDFEDKYNKVIQEGEMNEKNLQNTIGELNNKLDELNNLYNNCENEKLAFQNDYNELIEKHKKLIDNYCHYNKDDLNNLLDKIINFFEDKPLKDIA